MKITRIKKYIALSALLLCCGGLRAQFYSVGTNIPVAATTTLNMELSMTLDRKYSLHLPVYYNPFVFGGNKKLQNFTVLPGLRSWMLESYIGGFLGVNAIGTKYHFTWKDNRYQGYGFGAGISAGYALMLSPRWNLEAEVGLGLIWADYAKYPCEKCTRKIEEEQGWHVVPNKVGISLVYLF